MNRILVETALLHAETPALSGEALDHLKAIRPKDGEEVGLFDAKGGSRRYRYAAASRTLVAVAAASSVERPAAGITLFACVTKGSRWDWTIEKATELGVRRIVPVISARTIVRLKAEERATKRARWERVAADAARQSDAAWLPEIALPVDFAAALELVRNTDCYVGALVEPPAEPLAQAFLRRHKAGETARPPAVFVGPEGDFTSDELAAVLAIATPVSFGPTVLRAETAAIFGLSVLTALVESRRRI